MSVLRNGILCVSYDNICAEKSLSENLCLTISSRKCVRVKVPVNECTPQLADITEVVRFGSA
jgi:hypothetical protein